MRIRESLEKITAAGAICLLAVFALACERGPTSPESSGMDELRLNSNSDLPAYVQLCKIGPEGTWADFSISQDPAEGILLEGSSVTLNAVPLSEADIGNGCAEVWKSESSEDPDVAVTMTEADASDGLELDRIVILGSLGGDRTIEKPTDPSVTVNVNWNQSAYVLFKNSEADGLEGCTPGYWRQEHHFDSWPEGRSPGDMLTGVFTIPTDLSLEKPEHRTDPESLTLHDATVLRGGGVNALIRHAVPALLNAESPDVDYGMSASEVISAFNASVAGGDVEATKDRFVALNEEGCPLD